MKHLKYTYFFLVALCLSACNMPTPSAQIAPAYTSELGYEGYNLKKLELELYQLQQRERQLVAAQEERISSSKTQAFWWGYGKGDGMEAFELSKVRGEIDAVSKAIFKQKNSAE